MHVKIIQLMFSEDKIPVNRWLSKYSPALPMGKALEQDCPANICVFAWCQHAEPCSERQHTGPWPTPKALRCRGTWGAQACYVGSCWAVLKTAEGSAGIGCQAFLFGLPAIHMLTGRCTPLNTCSYPLYSHLVFLYFELPKADLSKPGHYSSSFLTWDNLQAGTG